VPDRSALAERAPEPIQFRLLKAIGEGRTAAHRNVWQGGFQCSEVRIESCVAIWRLWHAS
jgi:hypothetical protein